MLTVRLATTDVIGRGKVGLGCVSVEGLLLDRSLFNDLILPKPLRNDLFLRHYVVLHMRPFRLLFIVLFFRIVVILLLLLLHWLFRLIFHLLWLLFFLLGRQEVVDGDKDECH